MTKSVSGRFVPVSERIVALVGSGVMPRPVVMFDPSDDKCEQHHGRSGTPQAVLDRLLAGSVTPSRPVASGVDDFTIDPADAARKTLEAFRALPAEIRSIRDAEGRPVYQSMTDVYEGLARNDLDVHDGVVRNARGIRARARAKAEWKAELEREAAEAAGKGDKPV